MFSKFRIIVYSIVYFLSIQTISLSKNLRFTRLVPREIYIPEKEFQEYEIFIH